jgi:tetratricopeptide (TPR) repeat protein
VRYFEQFAEQNSDDPEVQRETASAYNWVATLQHKLGQHKEAEKACRRALARFQELAARPEAAAHAPGDLAFSYATLAAVLRDMNRNDEAEKTYRLALRLCEELATRYPDRPAHQANQAGVHKDLGTLMERDGRLAEAEGAYREAIRIQEKLANDPVNLTTTYGNLCDVLLARDSPAEAEKLLLRVVAVREELVKKTPSPLLRSALAKSYQRLGGVLPLTGKAAKAVGYLRQSADLFKKLADEFPGIPEYWAGQADSLAILGTVLVDTGSRPRAAEVQVEVFHLLQKLVKDHPSVPDYKRDLVVWHNNKGNMLKETYRLQEAEKSYRDALALAKELVDAHPDRLRYQRDLALIHSSLGELLQLLGRYGEAQKAHEEAVKLAGALVDKHGAAADRESQAYCCFKLALLFQSAGQPKEAEKLYSRVLGPFEKKEPGLPYRRATYQFAVAASYSNRAAMWAQADRLKDRREAGGRR